LERFTLSTGFWKAEEKVIDFVKPDFFDASFTVSKPVRFHLFLKIPAGKHSFYTIKEAFIFADIGWGYSANPACKLYSRI